MKILVSSAAVPVGERLQHDFFVCHIGVNAMYVNDPA